MEDDGVCFFMMDRGRDYRGGDKFAWSNWMVGRKEYLVEPKRYQRGDKHWGLDCRKGISYFDVYID